MFMKTTTIQLGSRIMGMLHSLRATAPRIPHPGRCARLLVRSTLVLAAISVIGCASIGAEEPTPAPPSQDAVSGTAATPSSSEPAADASRAAQVYVYPGKGQSAEQLDRDRYECYLWAVGQTGFNPSQPSLAPHQRVEVVPAPAAGVDTVTGAVAGAAIGAAVSSPRHAGTGAAVGAVLGGVLGSASDAARAQQAREIQRRYEQRESERLARIEQQSSDYRRAVTACLEGRGYTVK
jgi:hypothetical protein